MAGEPPRLALDAAAAAAGLPRLRQGSGGGSGGSGDLLALDETAATTVATLLSEGVGCDAEGKWEVSTAIVPLASGDGNIHTQQGTEGGRGGMGGEGEEPENSLSPSLSGARSTRMGEDEEGGEGRRERENGEGEEKVEINVREVLQQ